MMPINFSRSPGNKNKSHRGVALLMVIGSLAVLIAVAVEFRYQTNIDMRLATNIRDELKAEYLARSALNFSRVILYFQKQMEEQTGKLGNLGGLIPGGGGGGSANSSTNGPGLNLRLWDAIPIDCSLFSMFFPPSSSIFEDSPEHSEAGSASFGNFEGCFHAEIHDEEQKLNMNRLNGGAATGWPPLMQALSLFADPRFEFVFSKPDAHGIKMPAQDIIIAIHDWIDERDVRASLNLTGSGDPFPDGFGDENANASSRYPYRYRFKNAYFDTLDELYQIDGVSDLFMAAFRDRITVYPDKNKPLNINTNNRLQQYVNILSVAANENDKKLKNPVVIQSIQQELELSKTMKPSFMGMDIATFVSIVERNGISIKPEIKNNKNGNRWVSDKSETFSIQATGQAGRVTRTLTAVVRNNDKLGKLLYFRAE